MLQILDDDSICFGAKLIAFSDMWNASIKLQDKLEHQHYARNGYMQFFSDCKTLFDVISNETRTFKVRVLFDIEISREIYKQMKVNDASFSWLKNNISDCLSMPMNQAELSAVYVHHL